MIDMKINDEKGFSLIEILIAVTVFAIGILAVGKMQITAIKGNYFANDLTEATTLAQDRMEELIGLPYEIDPTVDTDSLDDTDTDNEAGLDDANATTADHSDPNNPVDGTYNVFWNIATNYPINNTKTIKININWTVRGAQKKVSITSIKAITI